MGVGYSAPRFGRQAAAGDLADRDEEKAVETLILKWREVEGSRPANLQAAQ
ncbi:hypothetical protein [Streptomyces sp. NPDC002490]|uniref:hypothetical protein n=1 Tax=Streptomyces sp. NPDC002490 TaxID=3154416 RepID=UPI00331B89A2